MNSEELEIYLRTEFTVIKTYPTRLISSNKENLEYFVESCHRSGITEISEIRDIIPLYYEKVKNLMNIFPANGTLTELSYYVAFHNPNFRREGFPFHSNLFE
jgi:hypothetical protein